MIMKKFIILIQFLGFVVMCRALAGNLDTNEWGAAANNIQIGIRFEGVPQVKTNQPFSAFIRVKNLSTNGPFYFYLPLALVQDSPFSFRITAPSGKDISPAPPLGWRGSGGGVRVLPNQIYEYESDLSWLCQFNELGTYKIVVRMKTASSGHGNDWSISNPLYLTVVPGVWKDTNAASLLP